MAISLANIWARSVTGNDANIAAAFSGGIDNVSDEDLEDLDPTLASMRKEHRQIMLEAAIHRDEDTAQAKAEEIEQSRKLEEMRDRAQLSNEIQIHDFKDRLSDSHHFMEELITRRMLAEDAAREDFNKAKANGLKLDNGLTVFVAEDNSKVEDAEHHIISDEKLRAEAFEKKQLNPQATSLEKLKDTDAILKERHRLVDEAVGLRQRVEDIQKLEKPVSTDPHFKEKMEIHDRQLAGILRILSQDERERYFREHGEEREKYEEYKDRILPVSVQSNDNNSLTQPAAPRGYLNIAFSDASTAAVPLQAVADIKGNDGPADQADKGKLSIATTLFNDAMTAMGIGATNSSGPSVGMASSAFDRASKDRLSESSPKPGPQADMNAERKRTAATVMPAGNG